PENTREPLHVTTTGPTHAPTNVHEPENAHKPENTHEPQNTHEPETTCVPDVSAPALNDVATPGPTRAADVHEAENTRAPAPNINESSPNKVCEPDNTCMSDMSSPTCVLNFDGM
ncbi:hypothetical protein DXG01_014721, partial [Tephrocybe rancida]